MRRRELSGVFDKLGDQMDDVRGRAAVHDPFDRRHYFDPAVVLDLGDGRAQNFVRGYRPAPLAPRDGPTDHSEAFGLSAQASTEVIDPEQALEQFGILDLVLQLVESLHRTMRQ